MCLRGKTAKYRKVEEVWPPLKFNFTYWVVFSGWFGQENYEKLCHFGLGLSSLALDIWRLDIWRLQTSYLKIPATKKVETPQVILLSCNGIPGILTIAWPIFSQLMTTEHSRARGFQFGRSNGFFWHLSLMIETVSEVDLFLKRGQTAW